ncbi:MAG TPA: EAL domain-containing protein [Acetobacteraceae bacterium]|nr:EAL domain-containing protein [Acetobacteraceae bacterium]
MSKLHLVPPHRPPSGVKADEAGEGRGDAAAGGPSPLERRLAAVEAENQVLRTVLENVSQGVCFFDGAGQLTASNRPYAELYGLRADQIRPGMTLPEILGLRAEIGTMPPMSIDEYMAWSRGRESETPGTARTLRLRNGHTMFIRNHALAGGGYVSTHEDITERCEAEAQIAFMAHHDPLTGLPNRARFNQQVLQRLARAAHGEATAILFLDLDNFKTVNDTLGHPVGDALLCAVADRLRRVTRSVDSVARLGGDEFAILQSEVDSRLDCAATARRIIRELGRPFDIMGHHVVIGASVGLALAPADGYAPDDLLKRADMALYSAKADGRGCFRFFERELETQIQARHRTELDLREALAAGQLDIHYQPIINVESGRIIAFEALVRWHHPNRGLVLPNEFIPLSEDIGLIQPIGDWVLHRACRDAIGWPPEIKVSVNVSPVQFRTHSVVPSVVAALRESGLAPGRLVLEITESVMIEDIVTAVATLRELKSYGIGISLDDFGTGYSFLSHLRSFPFDKIKIDRSFIAELGQKPDCTAIVRSVTGLCRSLNLEATAEGVETEAQMQLLRDEKCTDVQGFLFSRPRPAADIPAILAQFGQAPAGPGPARAAPLPPPA